MELPGILKATVDKESGNSQDPSNPTLYKYLAKLPI